MTAEGLGRRRPDAIDLSIIEALRRNGRAPISRIAAECNISRLSTYARVSRMEHAGTIRGYTVRADPTLPRTGVSAYVALRIERDAWPTVREQLCALDEVEQISLLGEGTEVMLFVSAHDRPGLRSLVLECLRSVPGVRAARTLPVSEEPRRA